MGNIPNIQFLVINFDNNHSDGEAYNKNTYNAPDNNLDNNNFDNTLVDNPNNNGLQYLNDQGHTF